MNCKSLINLIDGYATACGLTTATVSTYAAGSGDFYIRLKRGHDLTTRRAARVTQYLSDHWPTDLDWPADIPRPTPNKSDDGEAA